MYFRKVHDVFKTRKYLWLTLLTLITVYNDNLEELLSCKSDMEQLKSLMAFSACMNFLATRESPFPGIICALRPVTLADISQQTSRVLIEQMQYAGALLAEETVNLIQDLKQAVRLYEDFSASFKMASNTMRTSPESLQDAKNQEAESTLMEAKVHERFQTLEISPLHMRQMAQFPQFLYKIDRVPEAKRLASYISHSRKEDEEATADGLAESLAEYFRSEINFKRKRTSLSKRKFQDTA